GRVGRRRELVPADSLSDAAALDARDHLRGGLPGHRRLPHLRPRLRPHERRPGRIDDDAVLPGVPERLRVPALRLRVGDLLRDGHRRSHRDPLAVQGGQGQEVRAGVISGRTLGRVVSYLVLILIAVIGAAPFVYLLILSGKSQLQTFLEVPPTLHFDWATVKDNYSQVIHTYHYLTYVENSIIVTFISTLIALV